MERIFRRLRVPLVLVAALALAACGGGGSSAGGEAEDDLTDLVLIDVNVGGTDGVALNQVIVFEFSEEVVGDSVSPETMRIRLSPANAYQVPGEFNISGNVVEFFPRLPNLPDLSDSGLQPGQTYEIELPGYPKPNTLTNADGDALRKTYRVTFATAIASSPNLFIDYNPDEDPHVVSVNPKPDAIDVPQAIELELTFSEPLNPATITSSNVSLTLIERPPGTPISPVRPIPGQLVLNQSRESVVLRFVPDFPLADNAKYLLEVDRRVQDLVGNDLVPFQSHFTIRDEPPVPAEFVLDFEDGSEIYEDVDVTIASWNGDVPGTVCAIFTAGAGDGSDGDFKPTSNATLDADDQPGGVFNFRVVDIPPGVTVTVVGDTPATILSLASINIEGVLDASGAKGANSESNSSNWQIPSAPGGRGGPGGGAGGDVATKVISVASNSTWEGPDGGDGEDGYGTSGTGGKGGTWGNSSYPTYAYKMGAGGGGGGHRTAGKKGEDTRYTSSPYYGQTGGKAGGTGGNANLSPITAGGGGGSGVNGYYYYYPWNTGASAGGGGGGALTLASANDIRINGGKVLAEGGAGGTVQTNATYEGGTGGGGAGGAIYIKTLRSLVAQNATISTAGGKAGTGGNTSYTGQGGDGGEGWLRLHDGDGSPDLTNTTVVPATYGSGTFAATGAGAPSVAQTVWINLGIFDPVFERLQASDLVQEIPKAGQSIKIEVQGSPEDVFDLGNPDLTRASAWVDIANIRDLNGLGHSFVRFRITFTLASDQDLEDPVPYVDRIRMPFHY